MRGSVGPRWRYTLPDAFSHLLEGAHLDLAHALARDPELVRQLLERDRLVGEPARLEDAPLAFVEHAQGLAQCLAADVGPLALPHPRPPALAFVSPPTLPPPRCPPHSPPDSPRSAGSHRRDPPWRSWPPGANGW